VARKEKPPCLLCPVRSHARGLCYQHYQQAAGRVRNGTTTWQKLEAMGGARPAVARNARD
jgi:hypothetical protein